MCWSSGVGLGRVDKLHSLTRTCTKPTQGAFFMLGQTMGNTGTQDSPRPGLGGSHHLPLIVYSAPLHKARIQMTFCPKTPKWESQNHPSWTPATLEPHNFTIRPWIKMRSEAKVVALVKSFPTICCMLSEDK